MGWTVEDLAAQIGKSPHRILERTVLLSLRPEYQDLLASGNLKPSEATEIARLSQRGQTALFKAIRAGACKNYCARQRSRRVFWKRDTLPTGRQTKPPTPTTEGTSTHE